MKTMKSFARTAVLSLPLFLLLSWTVVHAQTSPCVDASSPCLHSPTGSLSSIPAFLAAVLSAIAKIGMPIITVYMVITGYMFVAAQGKPDKLVIAKRNFLYSVLGALLVLSSWVLANIIGNTVNQIVGP